MGDRVSVQYGKHWPDGKEWLSAVLCHHWGGPQFPESAKRFASGTQGPGNGVSTPLNRRDPDALMVHLISHLIAEESPRSMRLVPTKNDCDNSDNGHFIIWLDEGKTTIEQIELTC